MKDTQGAEFSRFLPLVTDEGESRAVDGPCVSIVRGFVNVSAHTFLISIRAGSPSFGQNAESEVAMLSVPDGGASLLTGQSMTSISSPEAMRILRDELPNIDVMISSQYSPLLADGLSKGKIDAAFLRREKGVPGLAFRLLVKEPLMVILPSDHHFAALKAVSPRDLVGETFVIVSGTAPVAGELLFRP